MCDFDIDNASDINFLFLFFAAVITCLLVLINKQGYVRPMPYAILVVVLWICVLKSGLHATMAGVVLAMTIPEQGLFEGKTV